MGKKARGGGGGGGFKGKRRDQGKTWQRSENESEAMKNLKLQDDSEDSSDDDNSEVSSSSENEEEEKDVDVPFQVAMWDLGQVRIMRFHVKIIIYKYFHLILKVKF